MLVNFMDKEDRKALSTAWAQMLQLGITAIACIICGILIGYWLDRWLGTTPWLLLLFSLLGCVAAIKAMIDLAKKI